LDTTMAAALTWVKSNNLNISACIITHPHPDHDFGWKYLKANLSSNFEYIVPSASFTPLIAGLAQAIVQDTYNWNQIPVRELSTSTYTNGLITLTIDLNTPAVECPVSALLYHAPTKSLFAGDNLFYQAHWPLGGQITAANLEAWRAWINGLSARYATDVTVYPGHGPTTGASLATVVADCNAYLDFFNASICATHGNITLIGAAFLADPRFGTYLNGQLGVAFWATAAPVWSAYYTTRVARGQCPSPTTTTAAAATTAATTSTTSTTTSSAAQTLNALAALLVAVLLSSA